MKKGIFQVAFLLISNGVFGQVISDTDIYDCLNNGFIPYIKNNRDTTILISGHVEQTVFNTPFHDDLYHEVIQYLENELSYNKVNIDYIKQQILNEGVNLKWDKSHVLNAIVKDTLRKYEGYHLSKPILSLDKTIFIIIEHRTQKPQPTCGFVHDNYMPMIFRKINNKWTFLKSFRDSRKIDPLRK